ncbi:uncharacterized protein LOC112568507 [Pomacea canaliculata]|uniref:uncharacterized protein LOC112568507 n=1 Tax=Pomacea canaliculata TaxID=400727 RepID=UPI000D725ADA|nr:uncharacterized protein LOC112568507 [Pomacea canaliculata]
MSANPFQMQLLEQASSLQIKTLDVSDNFTVIVSPGNITITADPQIEVGNYLVGQPITLTCNGMIGTYDPEEGQTWQWSWQYQDYESYSWALYQNPNDITKEPPFKGTSSCQYYQISRLTVNLTLEDSQRTYKCIVQATNNQGSSDAQYTLGIVADTDLSFPTTAVTSTPGPEASTNKCLPSIGVNSKCKILNFFIS